MADKKILHFIGYLIVIASIIFVLAKFTEAKIWQIRTGLLIDLLKYTFLCSIGYAVFSFSQSFAWCQLLGWAGAKNLNAKLCHGIYGRAQLAKYVPGNIFSIVGRHVYGRKAGIGDGALAWAAILEILGMVFISGFLFLIGLLFWQDIAIKYEIPLLVLALLLPLIFPFFLNHIIGKIALTKAFRLPAMTMMTRVRLVVIFLSYLPFFAAGGAALWWLCRVTSEGLPTNPALIMGISTGAWLIGYVTPGASGGIGVRDALLILALEPLIGANAASVSVVFFRLTTVLGDVFYFLLALLFPSRLANK